MKYIQNAKDVATFDSLSGSCSILPILIGGPNKQVFSIGKKTVTKVIDEILENDAFAETSENDYVKQINDILS